jgi:hypothetical protein
MKLVRIAIPTLGAVAIIGISVLCLSIGVADSFNRGRSRGRLAKVLKRAPLKARVLTQESRVLTSFPVHQNDWSADCNRSF